MLAYVKHLAQQRGALRKHTVEVCCDSHHCPHRGESTLPLWTGGWEGSVSDCHQRTRMVGIRRQAYQAWPPHPNLPRSLWRINGETRGPPGPGDLWEVLPTTQGPEGSASQVPAL